MAILFFVLFSRVYAMFSHGVSSFFMTYLCLPVGVGMTVEGLLLFCAPRRFRPWADCLFHAGTGTASVAFLLQGIFEIAGTDSPYMIVFVCAAGLCLVLSAVCFCLPEAKKEETLI